MRLFGVPMIAAIFLVGTSISAQELPAPPEPTVGPTKQAPSSPAPAQTPPAQTSVVACASKLGDRTQCQADTSKGVVLLRSLGEAPCLLGRTWGYDQTSVWVSDGCSAEFGTGSAVEPETTKPKRPHIPNVGFLIVDNHKGRCMSGSSATDAT